LFINNNVLSNEIPNLEKKRGRLWNIETIKEIYIIYADAVGMLKHRNGKFTLGKPPLLS
jgi:hypothetical protein